MRDLGEGVLLVQYLVLEDQSRILVTSGDQIQAISVPGGAKLLNPLVQSFYSQLKNPAQDPRPLGQQLHAQLIQPIQGLLDPYRPHTLLLYLDGVLRYLPLGALHDGQQYLAERYALPIYTAAARKQLDHRRQGSWTIAGLGVSQAHDNFPALPAVKAELNGIVQAQGNQGLLPGIIRLDEQFTPAALQESLKQDYRVLHLATHFAFRPGNEKQSFLLLGDGSRLDLGSLRTDPAYRFQDIDLLTLSACETALDSPGAKGQEIEGLGTLAQKKGAKGVLATLWPVADQSTGIFMQTLYRLRQEQHLSKAEALRQAQLRFIQGNSPTAPATEESRGRKLNLAPGQTTRSAADPDRPYAHPYYWAPFILMGNWL